MEDKRRDAFRLYKTDELMVKFLKPTDEGVKVLVHLRRRERRPGTLSMYENPVFECNVKDLLEKENGVRDELINVLIENSRNVRSMQLSRKVERNKDEEVSTD